MLNHYIYLTTNLITGIPCGRIAMKLNIDRSRIKRILVANGIYQSMGMSNEARNKLRQERIGIKRSAETIEKMRISLKGKSPSKETREKLSTTMKLRHEEGIKFSHKLITN
jgi:hypothetical protein